MNNKDVMSPSGRDNPHNILGHRAMGAIKKNHVYSKSPTNYKQVVDRLTKGPLFLAEQKVAMENQSYNL